MEKVASALKTIGQALLMLAIGYVLYWAITDAFSWAGREMVKQGVVKPVAAIPSEAEALCAAYGGVREVASKTFTVRMSVEETGLAVYCKDGSYVSRHTTGKP